MTESKLEAIALIERIPDEKSATVLKILQNVCELLGVDTNFNEHLTARIEQNLALMEEIENLIGEDEITDKPSTTYLGTTKKK